MAEQKLASKKRWFRIVTPAFLNEAPIGETLAAEPKKLVGKFMTASLASLTGDMKQQYISVKLRVSSVEDGTARTDFHGFEMSPSSIKRMVRRNSDRLDDSFVCTTAEGKAVRIKPVMLTASKTKGTVQRALRHMMTALVANEMKNASFEDVVKSIFSYKLQSTVRSQLKKTYPLKYFEIKKLELARKGKPVAVREIKEAPAEEEQAQETEA